MKVEEYVNPFNKKTYVRVGIVGVLKERLELVYTTFERFEGGEEWGWWKLKVSGIEEPIKVGDQWLVSQPTKLIEGEELEILLDKIDKTAWKLARTVVVSEGTPQTTQSSMQAKAGKAELPATNTETVKKWET